LLQPRLVNGNGNKQPLTYREKAQLKSDIFRLPASQLGGVIDIIRRSLHLHDEEIELDIDRLDTLRYVNSNGSLVICNWVDPSAPATATQSSPTLPTI
jgi:hypothetical protein